ncbi:FAD-binding oxidoreductase [Kribbella antibiotica]|uniref:FAD-binding oxidoreductase n=1 Tax=Kribbella antibiotica TaxID=190195 RepID=UPI00192D540F|nr:FAD-binding protein [Kribbella antibiotica]
MNELVEQLRKAVAGPVLTVGDDGFADELAGFKTNVVHQPDLVVGITSAADAAAVVAAAAGTPIRVLATGHGLGTPVTEGIVITTSRLNGLSIDPATKIAHIEAGCRWADVIAAAAKHGLAPIAGASGNVGCIGLLLGGGFGPLARTYGLGSDWVRGFELVTGAGEVVTANATEHPDLFWALRGGKGGFGVVTSVDVELVELTTLYGGSVFFDAPEIDGVVRTWIDWTTTLPEAATTSAIILRLPPLPFIPEPLRGKTVVSVRFAYVGDPAEGEKLFAPIRAAGAVLIDLLGEMPASQIASIHNDPTEPTVSWDRGLLLDELDGDFADAYLGAVGPDQQVPMVAVELRHLGGAVSRDVPEGSAVGGRSGAYTLFMVGAPDPSLFETVLPAVAEQVLSSVQKWTSAVNTVNLADGFVLPGSYEACWPAETLARLAEVRSTYDPAGRFPYGPR